MKGSLPEHSSSTRLKLGAQALATAWPDQHILFRNLGWSGDTVDGAARAHYTDPPSAYQRLLNQVTSVRPTVLVVCYGSNQAFEGKAARTEFTTGLERLLDDLAHKTRARIVLMSPAPFEKERLPILDPNQVNVRLGLISDAIRQIALRRGHLFLDAFSELPRSEKSSDPPRTSDGIHLTAMGYFRLASVLSPGRRSWEISIAAREARAQAQGATVTQLDASKSSVRFTFRSKTLPLPGPPGHDSTLLGELSVSGLEDGSYKLLVDGNAVATAQAKKWAQGVRLEKLPELNQVERLRREIILKNFFYFHHYRPQNQMYIDGDWTFMHGRYIIDETQQLLPLIEKQELKIEELRVPTAHRYKLVATAPQQ